MMETQEIEQDAVEQDVEQTTGMIAIPQAPEPLGGPEGEGLRVFAMRLTEAELDAIKAAAAAAGWRRGNGGVTGFVRALLSNVCSAQ